MEPPLDGVYRAIDDAFIQLILNLTANFLPPMIQRNPVIQRRHHHHITRGSRMPSGADCVA